MEHIGYIDYHCNSSVAKDIDPANDCLLYICDRFELNMEQRYWLAFIYSCTYCATTTYYIYNEFPDFENVNINRLRKWWRQNKHKTVFQTDRLRIKTTDAFIPCFISYCDFIGRGTQRERFSDFRTSSQENNYDILFDQLGRIKHIGRFTLFIYIEMIKVLTGHDAIPRTLNLREAESCRNGLAFAIDRLDLMNHFTKHKLSNKDYSYLQNELKKVIYKIGKTKTNHKNIFNIETTLCAYKKYRLGKRYVGFYIERMRKEIEKMQILVRDGVDWDVLWQFRKETYEKRWLKELS